LVSWSLLFVPGGIVGSAFFTALERVRESLLVAVARGFVLLLVGLALLPQTLGEAGIWLTPVFAEELTAAMTLFLCARWLGWSPAFQSIAVKAAAK
jgi:Na+-driven multidrug efflux pump